MGFLHRHRGLTPYLLLAPGIAWLAVFFVGKMSTLFATDGSYFFAHVPAPATGGM